MNPHAAAPADGLDGDGPDLVPVTVPASHPATHAGLALDGVIIAFAPFVPDQDPATKTARLLVPLPLLVGEATAGCDVLEVRVATEPAGLLDPASAIGRTGGTSWGVTIPQSLPESDLHARWVEYARTVISYEYRPGHWATLAGPGAVPEFPFAAPVHVLTAHNPFGELRSDRENAVANERLAEDLVAAGAAVTAAEGRSADGSYAEPSFIARALDRTTALELARVHCQEAIFEVTDQLLTLLEVGGSRIATRPRTAAV